MMEITVNGEPQRIDAGANVALLIRTLGLNPQLVAVEVNRELVRRAHFGEHSLSPGDRVEIVEFVGGG
jgi:thiamine biosynthesis protein ThiS